MMAMEHDHSHLLQLQTIHIISPGNLLIPLDKSNNPIKNKYFVHRYSEDMTVPGWLKVSRPMIILYKGGAFIMRYLTLINLALSSTPNTIFRVM